VWPRSSPCSACPPPPGLNPSEVNVSQPSNALVAQAEAKSALNGLFLGLGAASTAVYAHTKHWATIIPTEAWAGGIAASLIIGALAGLIPALRAARLSPTQGLWSV
jgi:putative ABC transport system permease protein